MEWGSHDALLLLFLWILTAHPNGAIVMRLELYGMLRYAYADNLSAVFAFRSSFTCISVFGMSFSHRFSGNESYTPHKTELKFPLNVCTPFYTKFMWCIPDGTN